MDALAGVALRPSTPIETLIPLLGLFDYVLLMMVPPGFAGQKLLPSVFNRITRCKALLQNSGYTPLISVDGLRPVSPRVKSIVTNRRRSDSELRINFLFAYSLNTISVHNCRRQRA